MEMELKILDNRITEDMLKPATDGSAGIDLRACIEESVNIGPGEMIMINTGISVHIKDPRYAGFIYARSGLASKHGIAPANMVGVVDSDYVGEIKVAAWNRKLLLRTKWKEWTYEIKPMDRIAQLIFAPVVYPHFKIIHEFSESTDRCEGGFGSTDK